MSALYLYGFLRSQEEPELPLSGLADEPLYLVSYQAIAAAVSFFPGRCIPLTATNLMAHEGALEVIMERYPVLPARFGTLLPDERAVESLLARHCHDLDSNLSQVEGKAEFSLKALWNLPHPLPESRVSSYEFQERNAWNSKPETATDSPGISYLRRRLYQVRHHQYIWDEADQLLLFIDTCLAPYASQSHLCRLPTQRMLLSAVYLVPRDNIPAFKRAFYRLKESTPALKFLLSGPWPPYNFVSVNLGLPNSAQAQPAPRLAEVDLPLLQPLSRPVAQTFRSASRSPLQPTQAGLNSCPTARPKEPRHALDRSRPWHP